MVAESKPFLEEESYFADAKFYVEDEECNSTGLTIAGFKIKGYAIDDNISDVIQPHQIIKGKSRLTCEGLSKDKKNSDGIH